MEKSVSDTFDTYIEKGWRSVMSRSVYLCLNIKILSDKRQKFQLISKNYIPVKICFPEEMWKPFSGRGENTFKELSFAVKSTFYIWKHFQEVTSVSSESVIRRKDPTDAIFSKKEGTQGDKIWYSGL